MATELFRILIVSSILGYVLVDGNSAGAPFRCCEDGTNIVPEHLPNAPSTSPFPFSVSVESGSYTPGENFDITLEGTTANENFKGFMIQGRLQADNSPIGNFNSTANYQTQCTGNTAATHTNGNEKTSVILGWIPPPVGTGGIYFRLAMVDAFDTFWANIETSCISEDPQVSAGTTVSGNNVTIILNSAVDEAFNCSLDGGSFQPCSSGDVFPDLSVGSHTIDVQFTPSGSCDASVVQLTLRFAIFPPFTLKVGGTIVGSKFTVDYTVSENATCTCQLDSDTAVPCDPGHMFTDVDPGSHTITVVCTSTGSGDIATATLPFYVTAEASASVSVAGDTVTLTLDSNANGTFQCSVDGGAFVNCVSGQEFSFTDGSHNIRVQFTPTGSTDTIFVRQLNFQIGGGFGLSVSATYSGNVIDVFFETSIDATCTCQLNSDPPVPCTSPHVFTGVSQEQEHNVTVTCTSTDDPSLVAQATVSGLQYLSVRLGLESTGTAIIVIIEQNIGASHRCRLDNGPFEECFSGFRFNGVSGGEHTVTLESRSTNGLTTLTSTGNITVRGEDAILITDIETDVDTTTKNYTFFFNLNEKLPALEITLQIDGLPIPFPYQCFRITESRCYCTFINSGPDAYDIGPHVLTFISTLNGETRGTTDHQFLVSDVAVARFRDATYQVVEGERIVSVVVEKFGSSTQELTAFIRYNPGTARPPGDYTNTPQLAQNVRLPLDSSAQITANLTVEDDTILECNETFTFTLESFSGEDLLTIDPAGNRSVVTIIDDDGGTVAFSGSRPIMEGSTGFLTVSILETISLSFTVTVESYECTENNIVAATPGEDYVPVNNTVLTFTRDVTSHRIEIVTLQDPDYEADGGSEIICLRIFNLVEPCPNYVSIGDDVQVSIQDDDEPNFTIFCHTVASGNSLTGWTIDLFYSTFQFFAGFTVFRCALNDATLSQCPGPSPTTYGPLSYANHTVTVEGLSAFGTQKITHQILIVLGRLRLYNSSAMQISIQSTKDATYECRLNNWNNESYFPCNDGDIIALPPNTYNLTVRATSTDDPLQTATDVAGPIILTGGSAVATCSGRVDLVTMDVSASTYTARWRARGEKIFFELAGRGQGWVGIGFSYNRIMTDSDIVLGAADDTGFFVDDRFAFVTEQTTPPPRDAIQNVEDTSASFMDGVTTVRFSRVRDTGDVNDYSLSDCIFFLYAWGGEVFNITTGTIAYHGINRRFVSDSLVCIPISQTFCPFLFNCGTPPTPGNGSVTYDNTVEGSVANYSCNDGFRLVGDDQTVCQSDATWSGVVPICIVDCGDLDAPENGDVVYDETLEGSVANYSCDFGYRLDGDDQRVCQGDSMWSGEMPSCIRIDCGSPGTLMNGTVDSNGTFVTSVATFMCDFGFNLIGDTQRICQENGNWSNMVPECERIDCGSPGTLMNGTVDFNGTFVTSIAMFMCDFGFDLVGDSQRVCQLNGTWSNMVPVCNPVDCGFPDVPSNGDGAVISTTLGSVVVYTCDDTYALCGDETRTCLPTGMWSGSVPNCTRAVATVDSTSHTVDEDAGPAVIGISLDQPNCVDIVIVLTPQEQSPVDASTLDFNSNPIMVTIMAGDTSGTAAIPITDDSIVEGDEDFDAILTTNTRGAIIGTPGQAEVTIIDDGDTLTVMFEMPVYNVSEMDEQVEVCLTSIGENEIPVTVTVEPSETGSAEEPGDFSLATSTVTFSPGQSRACYNQAVVNDDVPEGTESFDVSIIDNPAIDIGDPGVTRIDIIDDDGRMIMRNDTVIGDPLYTVPLQISDEMVESNPEVANTSLCYEIHGRGGRIYNLVSDTCTSINAEYMGTGNDTNIVSKVGYLAVDNDGDCQEITIDVMNCRGTVGSTEVTQSNPYDTAGIRVRKGRNYFRIALPNCERQDLVSWVICEEGNMLTFVITRGFNLQPTSHGLVAQFWNVPVELQQYNGSVPDDLNYYVVKVTPADGDVREFVGHLYDVSWDFTPIPCIYAGNRNAGPVYEFDDPNDSVIEGNYTEYEVSSLFDTQFTYRQFEDSRCST